MAAKKPVKKVPKSKGDNSGALDALQKFIDKYLIGPEAQKSFDAAGQIPLNMSEQPIMGYNSPTASLNGIARSSIAKAGLIGKGAMDTSIADFLGVKDVSKMLDRTSTVDQLKHLASLGFTYAPLKLPKGSIKNNVKTALLLKRQLFGD